MSAAQTGVTKDPGLIRASDAQIQRHPSWLGGAAAMMAVCITHPIDQTKIRVQTQQVRQGMLAVAAQTIRDSPTGFRGLWVGLTGSLLRQASYGATRFGVYNYLKQRDVAGLGKRKSQGHENLGLVINGALAGVAAGIAGGPAELVMVRMCSDSLKPPASRVNYRNAIQGLSQIAQNEGWQRMFRGMEATILRSVVMNATQLSAYDIIKKRFLVSGRIKDGIPLHLLTATLGGTIAVVACAPIDVMKSRIQASTQANAKGLYQIKCKTCDSVRNINRHLHTAKGRSYSPIQRSDPSMVPYDPDDYLDFRFFRAVEKGVLAKAIEQDRHRSQLPMTKPRKESPN